MKKALLIIAVVGVAAIAAITLTDRQEGLELYEKPWQWLAARRMDTGCASYAKLRGNVDHFTERGLVDDMPELSYFYYDEKGRIAGKVLAIQEDMIFGQFDHIVLDYHEDRVEMWRLSPLTLLRTFTPGPGDYLGTVNDHRLNRIKAVAYDNGVLRSYIAGELHTEQHMSGHFGVYHGRYLFQKLERWFDVELDQYDNPTYIELGHRMKPKTLQQQFADGFVDDSTVETKIVPYSRFEYDYDNRGNWIECTVTLLNADGSDMDSSRYTRTITYRD